MKKLTRFHRGLRIAVSYAAFYSLLGLIQPFLAPLLHERGYSPAGISAVLATAALCTSVAPIWVLQAAGGRVRGSRLIGGMALFALGGAFTLGTMAESNAPALLYVLALLAFSALYSPLGPMLDSVAVAATERGPWTFGHLRGVGSMGFIAASCTMRLFGDGKLAEPFHLGVLVISGLIVLACWALPREATQALDQKPPKRLKKSEAPPYPQGFVPLLAALALHWFTFGPYMYGYSLLAYQVGVPDKWVGPAWALAVATELVVFLFVAERVVERWGYRVTLSLAFAAAAARWLMVGLMPEPTMVVAAQVLHGPSFALFYVGAMAAIRELGEPHEQMRMQGAFTGIVTGFSAAVGIAFAGWAAGRFGLSNTFLIVCPVQAVALGLLWFVHRPLKSPEQAAGATASV